MQCFITFSDLQKNIELKVSAIYAWLNSYTNIYLLCFVKIKPHAFLWLNFLSPACSSQVHVVSDAFHGKLFWEERQGYLAREMLLSPLWVPKENCWSCVMKLFKWQKMYKFNAYTGWCYPPSFFLIYFSCFSFGRVAMTSLSRVYYGK